MLCACEHKYRQCRQYVPVLNYGLRSGYTLYMLLDVFYLPSLPCLWVLSHKSIDKLLKVATEIEPYWLCDIPRLFIINLIMYQSICDYSNNVYCLKINHIISYYIINNNINISKLLYSSSCQIKQSSR